MEGPRIKIIRRGEDAGMRPWRGGGDTSGGCQSEPCDLLSLCLVAHRRLIYTVSMASRTQQTGVPHQAAWGRAPWFVRSDWVYKQCKSPSTPGVLRRAMWRSDRRRGRGVHRGRQIKKHSSMRRTAVRLVESHGFACISLIGIWRSIRLSAADLIFVANVF